MRKIIISFLFFLFLSFYQNSFSQWAAILTGSQNDSANILRKTPDGGYILCGSTSSFGSGGIDIWVIKMNSNFEILWQKTYGGAGDDLPTKIEFLSDGNFIIGGITNSFGPDAVWLLKLNQAGDIIWQKTYGNPSTTINDLVYISELPDGNIGLLIEISSYCNTDPCFLCYLKINQNGSIVSQTFYKGLISFLNADKLSSGDFIIAGTMFDPFTYEMSIDVIKLNQQNGWIGLFASYSCFSDTCQPFSIKATNDGGYIVAGYLNTNGSSTYGSFILKLDSTGNVEWSKKFYNENNYNILLEIENDVNGGFIATGHISSYQPYSGEALWSLKISNTGGILWQKAYKVRDESFGQGLINELDKGYIFFGSSYENSTKENILLIKTATDGSINPSCTFEPLTNISDYPFVKSNMSWNSYFGNLNSSNTNITAVNTNVSFEFDCILCSSDLGDVNENNKITAYDASLILQYVVGLIQFSDFQFCKADTDNGKTVTSLDASFILQCTVGSYDGLPAEFLNSCLNHK